MAKQGVVCRICELYNEETEKKTCLLDYLAHSSKSDEYFDMLSMLNKSEVSIRSSI